MENSKNDFFVGLFVLLGVISIVFLTLRVGNMSSIQSDRTYTLQARFENIGGLKIKAPVKSAGVLIGRVTNIQYDNATHEGLVTFIVDDRFKFPKDSNANILTAGLLGEQYLGLEPGGDDKMLQNNDTIKLTQSAIVLEKLIGQFLFSKAQESDSKTTK